jgi:hypothetical protein
MLLFLSLYIEIKTYQFNHLKNKKMSFFGPKLQALVDTIEQNKIIKANQNHLADFVLKHKSTIENAFTEKEIAYWKGEAVDYNEVGQSLHRISIISDEKVLNQEISNICKYYMQDGEAPINQDAIKKAEAYGFLMIMKEGMVAKGSLEAIIMQEG